MGHKLFILGASGHAKMVIETIRCESVWEIACCLDSPDSKVLEILGVPVEPETKSLLSKFRADGWMGFVALGDNFIRRRLSQMLRSISIAQPTIIHPSAIVSPSAKIGTGCIIMPGVVVGASCQIGEGVILNTSSHIDHDGFVGDYSHVGPGCHLAGNVMVEEGVFLGVGASVVPKVVLGKWSMVGAGAVVIQNVPSEEVWAGNPARFLRTRMQPSGHD